MQVVGIVDPSADVDASDREIQQHHALVIRQELEWAAHLGMQACIVSLRAKTVSLAHILSQVRIPVCSCFQRCQ